MKKILVVGSYNKGLTIRSERIPVLGETLIGEGFYESHGGKGSNQAVAAARLGGDVSFVGAIGKDGLGEDAVAMLTEENINIDHVQRVNQNTGVGFIVLDKSNDNSIVIDKGANEALTKADIDALEDFIDMHDIIVVQLETSLEATVRVMELGHQMDKIVILNPAPADQAIVKYLNNVTITNPNESELLLLNGWDPESEIDQTTTEALAKNLLKQGPEIVIVTRGDQPTLIQSPNSSEYIAVNKVEPIDTTGAGDSFTGALAYALSQDYSLTEAVKLANKVGAWTVQKEGVIPALPRKEDMFNE